MFLEPQLELQSIVPRAKGYRAVLHLHLNYHYAWILMCRSALIALLRRRLEQLFDGTDEQQDNCILPLERYAGQCVESAKAMINLFETLQRLRYLGMFSYTDFQGCSTDTVVLILDCICQGQTPDSHFVETGLSCLEFMAIENHQAKTSLRIVQELRSIAQDVSEKSRLSVISEPHRPEEASGADVYEQWVHGLGAKSEAAGEGNPEATGTSAPNGNDQPRDVPVGSSRSRADGEMTDVLVGT